VIVSDCVILSELDAVQGHCCITLHSQQLLHSMRNHLRAAHAVAQLCNNTQSINSGAGEIFS